MKKEIIKPLLFFAAIEAFLISVFVLQNSAFALFFAFLFVFLSAATFGTAFLVKNKVSAKAVLPLTGEKGKELFGKIVLENGSAFPVFKAVLKVLVKNNLTGEENSMNISLSASPKSETEAEFAISSDFCGYITAKIERVWITDIFGIFPVKVKNFVSEKGKMTVLPETFEPVIVFDKILPVPEADRNFQHSRQDRKSYSKNS